MATRMMMVITMTTPLTVTYRKAPGKKKSRKLRKEYIYKEIAKSGDDLESAEAGLHGKS